MIESFLEKLEDKINKIEEKKEYFKIKPTICVVGRLSVGKSSFLNLLLGKEIFKSSIGENTKKITQIKLSDGALLKFELEKEEFKLKGEVYAKSKIYPEILTFLDIVDVPGYDKSYDEEILNYLKKGKYDIVLYILDIAKGLSKIDKELLELLKNRQPYVLFVLNKIDLATGEDKENFKRVIDNIQYNIEKIYPKNKNLGYVPVSAMKFRNNKTLIQFLQNIIIITSYVSTFKTNLNIMRNGFIENFNKEMTNIRNKDKHYINFYLRELKAGLDEISSLDIMMDAQKVLKELIDDLNSKLIKKISVDMERIRKSLNEEIDKTKKRINDMSISYIEILDLDLNYGISQLNLISNIFNFDIEQNAYSDDMFDELFGGLIISVGGGILAELALGALIPGIGTFVFLGSLVYTFINLKNKADEIREKVYKEVSRKLPSIIADGWENICNEIEKNYIQQIDYITNNEDINEFLDKLIMAAFDMNNKLSDFIIDNVDELCGV